MFYALLEAVFAQLFPVIPALQVGLISFGVFRITLPELFLFLTGQLEAHLFRDCGCDPFLHVQDVGEFAIVPLTPNLRAVGNINQVSLDTQVVTKLHYFPGQYGINAQFASDFLRINIFTLVAKHRGARQDTQLGQLREAVVDAFGDAVANIFRIGISGRVDERQDRHCGVVPRAYNLFI